MLNIVAALDLGKDRKRVAQPNRQPIKSRSRLNNTSSRATGAERCWRYLTLTAQSKASLGGIEVENRRGIVTARAAVVWPEGKENWSRRAVYWGNPDSDGKVAGSHVWQLDGQAARAAAPLEFGV